ncbi:nitronate monooxygenase family protein [bacterium]|nr:nitronate monooxygenase family protein [bacterium]
MQTASFPDQRVQQLLGIDTPIIQAGMVWASGAKLAAAVSNAGGLGLIGAGSMKPDLLREQIRKARRLTLKPFGVNIPLLRGDVEDLVQVVLEEEVKIIFGSAGSAKRFTPRFKEAGCVVAHVVPGVTFAKKVEDAGCDLVVAEGFEAGGHNGVDMVTTFSLIPQVVDAVSIPVLAAGGIADGQGIAAALALGASGVQIGTRFAATVESSAHDNYKQAVVSADDRATVFHLRQIGPARMFRNAWTERVRAAEEQGASPEELKEILGSKRERLGIFEGDLEEGQVEAGQGSGLIRDVPTVAELMQRLLEEYASTTAKFCT